MTAYLEQTKIFLAETVKQAKVPTKVAVPTLTGLFGALGDGFFSTIRDTIGGVKDHGFGYVVGGYDVSHTTCLPVVPPTEQFPTGIACGGTILQHVAGIGLDQMLVFGLEWAGLAATAIILVQQAIPSLRRRFSQSASL